MTERDGARDHQSIIRGEPLRVVRALEWLSRSMIATETPGWLGATKAHTAGMQLRSNDASRDGSAARTIDLAIRSNRIAGKPHWDAEGP